MKVFDVWMMRGTIATARMQMSAVKHNQLKKLVPSGSIGQ